MLHILGGVHRRLAIAQGMCSLASVGAIRGDDVCRSRSSKPVCLSPYRKNHIYIYVLTIYIYIGREREHIYI